MWVTGFRVEWATLKEIFQSGVDQGFTSWDFWESVTSQGGFLFSFLIGSLILCTLFSVAAYPLSLKWIKFYRLRRGKARIVGNEPAVPEQKG
jgi:uncharacterized protein (DUF2062 family)